MSGALMPLPSPDRLSPEQREWFDAQTDDVQDSLRQMAAQAAIASDTDAGRTFGALVDVTIAYRRQVQP